MRYFSEEITLNIEIWKEDWRQEKSWLKTFLVFYFFRVLRNDISWRLLSDKNREWILRSNLIPNLERPGYADPENYGGGKTFDSKKNRKSTAKGLLLANYLEKYQPKSVLEIGPGAGFDTRMICDFPSVKRYVGVDINPAFTDFLQPRLNKFALSKKDFSFSLHTGDFKSMAFEPVNSIIFLSAVHHIPDRNELFASIKEPLVEGGTLFLYEPSHYLPRIDLITRKFLRGYYGPKYRNELSGLATHNFCTAEEFEKVFHKVGQLKMEKCFHLRLEFPFFVNRILRAYLNRKGVFRTPENWFMVEGANNPLRFFANRIAVIAQKSTRS